MTVNRRAAIVPLLVGALLGFIGGYFAAGGGRPGASAAADAGAPHGAIPDLERAIERDPENPKLWTSLGNAAYDREDWPRAIRAYEKALRKAPNDPNVLSDLGAAYRNRGEFQRAIGYFKKARAADPDHWQSLLNLVLVYAYDLRDGDSARRAFAELKRRYPDIPNLDRLEQKINEGKPEV
ncbi:MAG TPA: tetratricopeptide repeat protein [Thermoanaerobaculia bacterium]